MQHVIHSPHDTPDLVDVDLLEPTAQGIARVISH